MASHPTVQEGQAGSSETVSAGSVPRSRRLSLKGWHLDRWVIVVLPGAAFLAVFFAYPAIGLLLKTFSEFIPPQTSGIDNITWFFSEPANVTILIRTVWVGLAVTLVTLLVGFPYAYLLTIVGKRVRMILLVVVIASFVGSLLVRSFSWLILFQENGPLNNVLAALGFARLDLSGTTTGVIIAMSQILVPLVILPVYATLQGIDRRVMQAAESLGARGSSAFARVILPLSVPGILAGGFMVFVLTLGFYVTPTLVGSSQSSILSNLTLIQISKLAAFGRSGAISLVMIALMLVFLAVVLLGSRRMLKAVGQQTSQGEVEETWGTLRKLVWSVFGVLSVAWLVVPSLTVIPLSFTENQSFAWPPSGFSLQWYEDFLTVPEWTSATLNTLKIGALTTIVCLVLGTGMALAIVRSGSRWMKGASMLLFAPTIMPLIVTGVGIYAIFLEWHLVGTTEGFVIAHTVFALPFATVIIVSSLRSLDERLDDAAASLGASPWSRFFHVTLPAIRPGLLTAAFIAFAFSFDETVFSLFVATAESRTLPVQIYQGITRNTDPTVTAAATVTFLVTLIGALAICIIQLRKDRRVPLG